MFVLMLFSVVVVPSDEDIFKKVCAKNGEELASLKTVKTRE